MYFNNAEWFLSKLYPALTWSRDAAGREVFLTFDDGPIPGITEWVLEVLQQYQVKATFFCVGGNIEKYPEVFKKIVQAGHKVGNHTFNHLNGWKNETENYISNISRCQSYIEQHISDSSAFVNNSGKILFRPPYGKISKSQIKLLKDRYEIVMWNVLTGDFNKDLSEEKCLHKAVKFSRPGSIVIFHDSIKAEKNLKYVLPRYLDELLKRGYIFKTL